MTEIDLHIPGKYIRRLLDLPKLELAALMRALIQYARMPELYTEALPPAPLSVHELLAEIVSEQTLTGNGENHD